MKRILVTGASGSIGRRLVTVLGAANTILTPSRAELDITGGRSVYAYIRRHMPDIILHCASYTDLSGAERERGKTDGTCYRTNVEGAQHVVGAGISIGAYCIALSTDYVFPGTKADPGPYPESHPVSVRSETMSWYGYTKAIAEQTIRGQSDPVPAKVAVLRLNNVIFSDGAQADDGYLGQMIGLYRSDTLYPLFTDQHVSLTDMRDVSGVVRSLCSTQQSGIFHISSTDVTTPLDIIRHCLRLGLRQRKPIESMTMEQWRADAQWGRMYHQHMGLSVADTEHRLGVRFRTWKEIVESYITENAV